MTGFSVRRVERSHGGDSLRPQPGQQRARIDVERPGQLQSDARLVGYTPLTDPTTLPTGASATYDAAGELTSSTTGSTTTAYSYESIGARTKVAPSTGPTTTFGYNVLGQMTSAKSTATAGPLSGTGVAFTYGATGLPAGKTTNAGATTTLVWDTAAATPELLTDGADDLIYGPTGRAVEQVNTTTTAPTYLVQDQLGSTRLLTDQAGTVVGTYGFDAYGNVTSHTGTATSPIGYAGGFETATTGLVNFDHRWLTTGTTSWLTVNPLVATTTQPYQYAADDSVNQVDPSGEKTLDGGRYTVVTVDPLLRNVTGSVAQINVYTPFFNDVSGMTSGMTPRTVVRALTTLWQGLYLSGKADGSVSWAEGRLFSSPTPNVENSCSLRTSTTSFLCYTVGTLTSPISAAITNFRWYTDQLPTYDGEGNGTSTREGSIAYMIMNSYEGLFSLGQEFLNELESLWEGETGAPDWLGALLNQATTLDVTTGTTGTPSTCLSRAE